MRTRATMPLAPLLTAAALLGAARHSPGTAWSVAAGEDLWELSRAAYAALHSYADTGVLVTHEKPPGAPGISERHTFTTFYQAPRRFYFDFAKDPQAGKERLVIWSDGGDFQSWWSATGVHQTYPQGTGASAFGLGSFPTKGSVVLIPPLLFPKAGLQGPLTALKEPRFAGDEELDGHKVHKLVGTVTLAYASGLGGHPRPTTVWIDAQTLLIRKIFQDTPSESPAASSSQVTTTFRPQADPQLADSLFRFAVPGGSR
jgi:hypothetical protein